MRERRSNSRRQARQRILVRDRAGGHVLGRLVDLTGDGLLVLATASQSVGSNLPLTIPLPDPIDGLHEIDVDARVIWCEPDGTTGQHRLGLAIPDLGGREAYVIAAFLGRLPPRG